MTPFVYHRAADADSAVGLFRSNAGSKYLGGGTNLVDLMRETIERPEALIDVTLLPDSVQTLDDGTLRIGAATKNTAIAANADVRSRYPLLSRAILAGASGQIRNMATAAGNLLQRTRCLYFYDDASRCNKREPGAGCDAREGFNRYHAILGASPSCIATHPSDMCVALVALDARVNLLGCGNERAIALADLHRLPGDRPDLETAMKPGELITSIDIPPLSFARRSTYRKVRDRASYAFALVSVAAAIDMEDGVIRDARIAMGGVAPKPWRAPEAEAALRGQAANEESFRRAADAALKDAVGLRDNAFKIELAKRTLVAVLSELAGDAA
jgi:xanthine dehydrogenase YagS FAD-binding subunit